MNRIPKSAIPFLCLLLCLSVLFGCQTVSSVIFDGKANSFDFDADAVTELLVTAPDKPEALSIVDREEIEAFLSEASYYSSHVGCTGADERTYIVRVFKDSEMDWFLLSGHGDLYDFNFARAIDRLADRLKRGESNCYVYSVAVPNGLHYDDATAYLEACGYAYRNHLSNDRYPYLVVTYTVSDGDLKRYTEAELSVRCALGEFPPDEGLSAFVEQLRKQGLVRSCDKADETGRVSRKDALIGVTRGVYVYLTKYLTETELANLQTRADEAQLELRYTYPGMYANVCDHTLLLSESPFSDERLQAIGDALAALVP